MTPLRLPEEAADSQYPQWWLDASQSHFMDKSEESHAFEAVSSAELGPTDTTDVLMGYEEVEATRSASVFLGDEGTARQQPLKEEGEEDLVVTAELTRVNSFDFVIYEARDREAKAAVVELMESSIRYERTVIETPPVAFTSKHMSLQRYSGALQIADDIELHDLEAGHARQSARRLTWLESIAVRVSVVFNLI